MSTWTDPNHPSPSLYVSHLWRGRILRSLGGIRFCIDPDKKGYLSSVIEFAQHVKELKVPQYRKGTWLGDLIGDNDFSSLRELHIESKSCHSFRDLFIYQRFLKGFTSIHIGNFLSSLKSISSSLTYLALYLQGGPMLGVSEVVLACPSLNVLRMVGPNDADVSLLPTTTWPAIIPCLHTHGYHMQSYNRDLQAVSITHKIGAWTMDRYTISSCCFRILSTNERPIYWC